MIDYRSKLPPKSEQPKFVVVLSGGLDSTCAMAMLCHIYGAENVRALSFLYGQRQRIELDCAAQNCNLLGVTHKILDLSVLGDISKGFSANTDTDIEMPTIEDVIGDPSPVTYVPNRNMILLSLAASFAEVNGCNYVVTGLQSRDEYGYWDTSPTFVEKVNEVLNLNRIVKIKIIAPFNEMKKSDEIKELIDLYDLVAAYNILGNTMTCYNPVGNLSCGTCPSCAERLKSFSDLGLVDPVIYKE